MPQGKYLQNGTGRTVVIGGLRVPAGAVVSLSESTFSVVKEIIPAMVEVRPEVLSESEMVYFMDGYFSDVGYAD